jgi:surface antigen
MFIFWIKSKGKTKMKNNIVSATSPSPGCTDGGGKTDETNVAMVEIYGAVVGADLGIAGKKIGAYIKTDLQEQKQARMVALQNNRDGSAVTWQDASGNTYGSTKTYIDNGRYCSEYIQNASD